MNSSTLQISNRQIIRQLAQMRAAMSMHLQRAPASDFHAWPRKHNVQLLVDVLPRCHPPCKASSLEKSYALHPGWGVYRSSLFSGSGNAGSFHVQRHSHLMSTCMVDGTRMMGQWNKRWGRVRAHIPNQVGTVLLCTVGGCFGWFAATQDIVETAGLFGMGLGVAALVHPVSLSVLRRSPPGKLMSRVIHRWELEGAFQNRFLRRIIANLNHSLTEHQSMRDDLDAIKKILGTRYATKGVVSRHLGDNVQLGVALVARECKMEGDRTVEAIWTVLGRNNASWRDGWTVGEFHVYADGNCSRPHLVSVTLVVEGVPDERLLGRGGRVYRHEPEPPEEWWPRK